MPKMELAGGTYEVDENGFLQETDRWNEDIAMAYAALEDVNELTEEHWKALNYLRNYYLENGICPMIRRLKNRPVACYLWHQRCAPQASCQLSLLPQRGQKPFHRYQLPCSNIIRPIR